MTFNLRLRGVPGWRMHLAQPCRTSRIPLPANDPPAGRAHDSAGGAEAILRRRAERLLLAAARGTGLLLALLLAIETLP